MELSAKLLDLKKKSDYRLSGIDESRYAVHVKGLKKNLIFLFSALNIFWIALKMSKNPVKSITVLRDMTQRLQEVHGDVTNSFYVRSGAKYYWAIHTPAWPSVSFRKHIQYELRHYLGLSTNGHLQTIIFSVTSKCHFKCAHCFERDNLDSTEHLSLTELKLILKNLQAKGISQVQISGGEPLHRYNDVIELLRTAKEGTDFILLTSGYGLTADKADEFKKAGLTGINISLDHWDEKKHNEFRNHPQSFDWVKRAAVNAYDSGLLVAFSLCATREFTTIENLWQYLEFTRQLGASFIQILEPRSVGRFKNKDVALSSEQIDLIIQFYLETNRNQAFKDYPIVYFPGYHQRHYGCFGAGERYMFIDSKGDIHACPFCQNSVGNALIDNWDETMAKLKNTGCHVFKTAGN